MYYPPTIVDLSPVAVGDYEEKEEYEGKENIKETKMSAQHQGLASYLREHQREKKKKKMQEKMERLSLLSEAEASGFGENRNDFSQIRSFGNDDEDEEKDEEVEETP